MFASVAVNKFFRLTLMRKKSTLAVKVRAWWDGTRILLADNTLRKLKRQEKARKGPEKDRDIGKKKLPNHRIPVKKHGQRRPISVERFERVGSVTKCEYLHEGQTTGQRYRCIPEDISHSRVSPSVASVIPWRAPPLETPPFPLESISRPAMRASSLRILARSE